MSWCINCGVHFYGCHSQCDECRIAEVAATMPKETLSPRTMHKGSPGRTSAWDTFPCYNCGQPVERIHAKPDEGYCARCDKVVSERPPLMPGRPDTFTCPKGHTAKRIMWSLNGWCDECGDIVEEEE